MKDVDFRYTASRLPRHTLSSRAWMYLSFYVVMNFSNRTCFSESAFISSPLGLLVDPPFQTPLKKPTHLWPFLFLYVLFLGLWTTSGPFPLSAHFGFYKRGRDLPTYPSHHLKKKGVNSFLSNCSRKVKEGVQSSSSSSSMSPPPLAASLSSPPPPCVATAAYAVTPPPCSRRRFHALPPTRYYLALLTTLHLAAHPTPSRPPALVARPRQPLVRPVAYLCRSPVRSPAPAAHRCRPPALPALGHPPPARDRLPCTCHPPRAALGSSSHVWLDETTRSSISRGIASKIIPNLPILRINHEFKGIMVNKGRIYRELRIFLM